MNNTFGDVTFEQFQAGDVVIVPVKAVRRPGGDRYDTTRAAFSYEVDIPNANLPARERYMWGSLPINNGLGTFHFHHERLAFDLKAKRVSILPRGGLARVSRKSDDGTQFWCRRDALSEATATIAGGDACPTAFIRTTGETKGPPLLVGLQKEAYVIDAGFVASLIQDLHLDEEAGGVRDAETMNRQLGQIRQVQEAEQQQASEERERTAGARGQALIDQGEIGARLCGDIMLGNQPAVISAFLEGVRGDKVQLRVNSIQSPDGRSTFTLKAPIEGVAYTPGNVVWVDRQKWRACE